MMFPACVRPSFYSFGIIFFGTKQLICNRKVKSVSATLKNQYLVLNILEHFKSINITCISRPYQFSEVKQCANINSNVCGLFNGRMKLELCRWHRRRLQSRRRNVVCLLQTFRVPPPAPPIRGHVTCHLCTTMRNKTTACSLTADAFILTNTYGLNCLSKKDLY